MRKPINLILISLFAGCLIVGGTTAARGGTVTGRMQMLDGSPMAGGMVLVFNSETGSRPNPKGDERPPDMTDRLDSEGAFKIKVPAGQYYFGAIIWQDGGPGPPIDGDIFFILENKVRVPAKGLVELGELTRGKVYREKNGPGPPL